MHLVEKKEIERPNKTYNLHIQNDHNYIVQGAVVSNCHASKANILKQLLTGPFANVPIRWGLTGTVPKEEHDYTSLLIAIGKVIAALPAATLQREGVLADCHVNIFQMKDDIEYPTYPAELTYLTTNNDRLTYLSTIIKEISLKGNTLVLVQRIKSGKKLKELLPDAVFVQGKMKAQDRKDHYDSISNTDNRILIGTYGVASVGINIPRIYNLVLVEPGKSFVRVIQTIGRGLRKTTDKDSVNIYDICSSTKFSKRHLTERKKIYKDAEYPFTIKKIDWRGETRLRKHYANPSK